VRYTKELIAAWAFGLALSGSSKTLAAAAHDAAPGVRQARIAPEIVHIELINSKDMHFSRLSRAQGVSQTRVSTIIQGAGGFLWFATQYGLNRYDGYSFRHFKHDDADPGSLTESYVRVLFKDRDGVLWAASNEMFDRYDPTTESFVHQRLNVSEHELVDKLVDTPRHISQDADRMLWVASGLGLVRVDPATGRATTFRHRDTDPTSLSSDDVKSSCVDRAGTLWVATAEGVDALDRNTGRVTMHVPLREPRAMSVHEDRSGRLWIIHDSGDGLASLDRNSGVLTQYSFAQHPSAPDRLTGVSAILEDEDGQLWVGTHSDGLLRLDEGRLRANQYRNDPLDLESLAENRITTLMQDQEGTIWVGLGATEPNYFRPHPPPFRSLPFDLANPNNLGEKLVNVLYEDRAGSLWVGTTGALSRYDRATRRYTAIKLPGPADGSDVLSVAEDGAGILWVGTSGQGLVRLDLTSGKAKIYRHTAAAPASLSNDTVTHLLIDHSGNLWATTLDGLNRYDPATDTFRSFRLKTPWHSALYVSVMEDTSNTLWISGVGGALHFDPATEQFRPFEEGLRAQGYTVLAASNGEVWAGTQSGLFRFNPATHETRIYRMGEGLASNAISCLLEDAQGDIWMSTTEGLSRFLTRSGQFRNYSVQDGLPGRDFTGWSACFKSPRGELYFGGFAGAVEFDPAALIDNPFTPPIVLTQLEIGGLPVELGPDSPLSRSIGYTSHLRLSGNQRTFAIEFAALSFRSPTTNRYRYRLDGLDTDWREVGSERRIASYTTLPAGKYIFRVQGATNGGPWSDPGVRLDITIEPPWWATWQFRALVIAAVAMLAFAVYAYRIRQIAHTLEIRFHERIGERTRIARDLHDTLLQSFQGLLLQFQSAYRLLPDRVDESRARLATAIQSAFEAITEGRDAVQGLRASPGTGNDLAAALKALGEDLANQDPADPGINVPIDVAGSPRPLQPLARDEIYRIAGEALRNAFRHAGATRIEVDLCYDAAELRVRIRDSGKGIDPQFLRAPGKAGHYGIHGMRERAKLIGATLSVWSAVDAGTEVELTIPAQRAYATAAEKPPASIVMKFFKPKSRSTHE
jgi:signal transduction histidine kinase/ligand-binding sensor domain-containing protein